MFQWPESKPEMIRSRTLVAIVLNLSIWLLSGLFNTSVAYALKCSDVISPQSGGIRYDQALQSFLYKGGKTYAIARPGSFFQFDAGITRGYLLDGPSADLTSLKKQLANGKYGAAMPVTIRSAADMDFILKNYGQLLSSTYINAWREYGSSSFKTINSETLSYTNWNITPSSEATPSAVLMEQNGKWVAVTSGGSGSQIVEFNGKLDCAIDLDFITETINNGGGSNTGSGSTNGPGLPNETANTDDPYAIPNVLCGQDLNLNGYVDEIGEILNCLQSPQGQLCVVGQLDCNTDYQAPICPSDSILNTDRDMCQDDPTVKCPDGYTWDITLDKCVMYPPCLEGGAYNTITDRCEKLMQSDCPTGYILEQDTQICQMAVICPNEGTHNVNTDRCEKSVMWDCTAGVYNSNTNTCDTVIPPEISSI